MAKSPYEIEAEEDDLSRKIASAGTNETMQTKSQMSSRKKKRGVGSTSKRGTPRDTSDKKSSRKQISRMNHHS